MLRIFCSTNHEARRERDALVEQVGVMAAENARLRAALAERDAALAEARESVEFYFDLFCLERARQGAGR